MTMHGYRAISKGFLDRTNKLHDVKQLQNKYALLKKDWQSWSKLMDSRHGPTGISYNEAMGLIQASDDWWAHYEKQSTTKELQKETMFLGISLLDRFLSKGFFKNKRSLQIVGIACLALATRIEENQPFPPILKPFPYPCIPKTNTAYFLEKHADMVFPLI
ncbi:Cyclin-SDS [Camellia lanceoleosa]|uniref:Cyclin-SDS n=1 Tax=Camellia lanceoleosa TaxID=1840588 RepID=A0ACC0IRG8_9ERIC|nr:Cyclin-SDS [Camellia lanceoleosa]